MTIVIITTHKFPYNKEPMDTSKDVQLYSPFPFSASAKMIHLNDIAENLTHDFLLDLAQLWTKIR